MSLRLSRDALFVRVPLHGRGGVRAYTLVDLADEPLTPGRRWHLTTSGYARANRPGGGMDYLHRLLMGLADGDRREVDHINRDRLDNRRENLRLATRAENCQNLPSVGRSQHRGVAWDSFTGRWRATVHVAGRTVELGRFVDEAEAGAAAASARRRLHPFSDEARQR